MDYFIGLMSGTSVDGIDAVLVDFGQNTPKILAAQYVPYDQPTRDAILSLCHGTEQEIERLGELDNKLGHLFGDAVQQLLADKGITTDSVKAIGSHGQTIRHRPNPEQRFTLQIGDPNIIAAKTGITTVSDFRRKDMAHGGQGAPLVPAFHQALFNDSQDNQVILNIGGIANVTILTPSNSNIIGFDTGPGNTLMDAWIEKHQGKRHDEDGRWAASGKLDQPLLQRLKQDNYFGFTAPKSTGREYFNLSWLNKKLPTLDREPAPENVQATLTELTAQSIIDAINQHIEQGGIFVCGGGAHNTYLMNRLSELAGSKLTVTTTEAKGIHPDWVEATAFAWLAKQTINRLPGNHPGVTGASKATILGGVYFA